MSPLTLALMINLLALYGRILEVRLNYSSTFQKSFQLALFEFIVLPYS